MATLNLPRDPLIPTSLVMRTERVNGRTFRECTRQGASVSRWPARLIPGFRRIDTFDRTPYTLLDTKHTPLSPGDCPHWSFLPCRVPPPLYRRSQPHMCGPGGCNYECLTDSRSIFSLCPGTTRVTWCWRQATGRDLRRGGPWLGATAAAAGRAPPPVQALNQPHMCGAVTMNV